MLITDLIYELKEYLGTYGNIEVVYYSDKFDTQKRVDIGVQNDVLEIFGV